MIPAATRRGLAVVASVLLILAPAGAGVGVAAGAHTTPAGEFVDVAPGDLPGAGTPADPYRIGNASQLQAVADDLDAHYRLVADIDASDTAAWHGGAGFDPIGWEAVVGDRSFTGSFDGAGHTISGLTIDRPAEENVGLFGYVGEEGSVTNLTLTGVTVSGDYAVGGLAGYSDGLLRAVTVTGTVSGDYEVGGLAGYTEGGTVADATARATVTANVDVGGLIGYDEEGTVVDSSANATVTGESGVGGLIGYTEASTVRDSAARARVSGRSSVGGLVGDNVQGGSIAGSSANATVTGEFAVGGLVGDNSRTGVVRRSVADAAVSGDRKAGGLIGDNGGRIAESYATGPVTGNRSTGGLVGDNLGRVVDAYATGPVTGNRSVGGLIGTNAGVVNTAYAAGQVSGARTPGGLVGKASGVVTGGYWDATTGGQSDSPVGTGLNTDRMTGAAAVTTLAEFEFPGTWQPRADDYPALAWQETDGESPLAATRNSYVTGVGERLSVPAAGGVLADDLAPATAGDLSVRRTVRDPSHGRLSLAADGSFEYVPEAGFAGQDSFVYEIQAGDTGDTRRASVTVTVTSRVDVAPGDLPGAGTPADPYRISNASQLQAMADEPGAHYRLSGDVDASDTAAWHGGAGFDPIGSDPGEGGASFTGSFDGAGHTISGLTVDRQTRSNAGLFGYVGANGSVTNVTIDGATVTGFRDVGGLAGESLGRITRVEVVSGTVTGVTDVGGLVGEVRGASLTRTAASATVSGRARVGGLAGTVDDATVTRSAATGSVTGPDRVGGLAGVASDTTLGATYATGRVSGDRGAGGLVGVADNTTVEASYAAGRVTGNRSVGGLVGASNGVTLRDAYWDVPATGQPVAAGGPAPAPETGLDTPRMTGDAAPFYMSGLDFGGTWVTRFRDYPGLAWRRAGG